MTASGRPHLAGLGLNRQTGSFEQRGWGRGTAPNVGELSFDFGGQFASTNGAIREEGLVEMKTEVAIHSQGVGDEAAFKAVAKAATLGGHG